MRWIRAQNAQGPCRLPAGDVIRSLGHAIAICDSGRQAVGSHRLLASTNRIGQTLRRWGWLHPWESKYLAKLWLVGKVASLIGLYNPRRWYPGWKRFHLTVEPMWFTGLESRSSNSVRRQQHPRNHPSRLCQCSGSILSILRQTNRLSIQNLFQDLWQLPGHYQYSKCWLYQRWWLFNIVWTDGT